MTHRDRKAVAILKVKVKQSFSPGCRDEDANRRQQVWGHKRGTEKSVSGEWWSRNGKGSIRKETYHNVARILQYRFLSGWRCVTANNNITPANKSERTGVNQGGSGLHIYSRGLTAGRFTGFLSGISVHIVVLWLSLLSYDCSGRWTKTSGRAELGQGWIEREREREKQRDRDRI